MDGEIPNQSIFCFDAVLYKKGMAAGIICDVIFDEGVVNAVDCDCAVVAVVDRGTFDVRLAHVPDHVPVHWVPTDEEPLAGLPYCDIRNPGHEVVGLLAGRMHQDVAAKLVVVRCELAAEDLETVLQSARLQSQAYDKARDLDH